MKIYLDVDTLNAKFWSTPLAYVDENGNPATIPATQVLTENGPVQEVDETKPWVRWTINPGGSKRTTQGETRLFKNLGTAVLEVFLPKGVGTGIGEEIRDSLIKAMADWRSADKELRIYKHSAEKGTGTKNNHQLDLVLFYEAKREA